MLKNGIIIERIGDFSETLVYYSIKTRLVKSLTLMLMLKAFLPPQGFSLRRRNPEEAL